MQPTSFDPSSVSSVRIQLWLYRIGGYLLINVMDDPAWLAMMFC
jgi:hypothetical protein